MAASIRVGNELGAANHDGVKQAVFVVLLVTSESCLP